LLSLNRHRQTASPIASARALLKRNAQGHALSGQFDDRDKAIVALGRALRERGYHFTTPTPATHALVNAREANRIATSLTDVFGWSRAFELKLLPDDIADHAAAAQIIGPCADGMRSTVRFSTLEDLIFVHSAFPTSGADAVFFGPDTYRFARLLKDVAQAPLSKTIRIIDIGCGSGAGGLYLSRLLQMRCDVDLVLGDVNANALRFSRINARLNDIEANVVRSDVLKSIDGTADLIVANPPYLVDASQRVYRHGGGEYGSALSLRIIAESIPRLRSGGRLVLYTGCAIVDGVDTFWRGARALLARGMSYNYEEIDPDVFGEELREGPYQRADRIAVVALTVRQD